MKYLITGATGFIGPYLVRRLLEQGHECRCLARSGSDKTALKDQEIEWREGDITQPATIEGIAEGVDTIIHMATLGHMSNFSVSEDMFWEVNVNGTRNMMAEALNSGVSKVVHCSTVAAMGICREIPADEQSRCRPHHTYGRSKLEAEQRVLDLVHRHGLPATIIRFSMVYGPGDPRDILKLTRMAKMGLFPKVGKRPKLTPLIHVEDAVQGILLAAEKGRNGEIYLITNPESEPFDRIGDIIRSNPLFPKFNLYIPEWAALGAATIIEKLYTLAGKTPPVSRKNMESTLADRVFSIKKARGELGFHPQIDPADGLRETVRWYQENGWL